MTGAPRELGEEPSGDRAREDGDDGSSDVVGGDSAAEDSAAEDSAAEDSEEDGGGGPEGGPRGRARWPRILLVVGALAVAFAFERTAPRTRTVRLRLADSATIVGVEATWYDGDGEALGASRWTFAAGRAPSRVDAELRLRRGESLRADVRVVRDGGVESRHATRATVEAEELVPLELP